MSEEQKSDIIPHIEKYDSSVEKYPQPKSMIRTLGSSALNSTRTFCNLMSR